MITSSILRANAPKNSATRVVHLAIQVQQKGGRKKKGGRKEGGKKRALHKKKKKEGAAKKKKGGQKRAQKIFTMLKQSPLFSFLKKRALPKFEICYFHTYASEKVATENCGCNGRWLVAAPNFGFYTKIYSSKSNRLSNTVIEVT